MFVVTSEEVLNLLREKHGGDGIVPAPQPNTARLRSSPSTSSGSWNPQLPPPYGA
jgi:hypothetical protein